MCRPAVKAFRQGVTSLNPQSKLQPPSFNAEVFQHRSGAESNQTIWCRTESTLANSSSVGAKRTLWETPPMLLTKAALNFDRAARPLRTQANSSDSRLPEGEAMGGPMEGDQPKDSPSTSSHPLRPPTYYSLLGIAPSATKEEIHGAFLRRAMIYHPDVANAEMTADAVGQFQAVQKAYSILSDPELRRRYDQKAFGLTTTTDLQEKRREFWRRWYQSKQHESRAGRYTSNELLKFEETSLASEAEYRRSMANHFRKMARQREERRLQSYKEAQARYSARVEEVRIAPHSTGGVTQSFQKWLRSRCASTWHHIQE